VEEQAMKIGGINRPQVDATSRTQQVAQRGVSSSNTKVLVSNEARQLAEARSPAVSDAAKVQRLTEAIARGQFMVDAERLTDRMLNEEL
jgi:flagellar biosynthesis anti-sigma factor FlgM